jgi:uncharacterized protein (DUF1501 family)
MKRRDFLKLVGMGGAATALTMPAMRVFAATDNYAGPLWLFVNATGGWDPTSLWDPKGYTSPTDPLRVNNYARTAIGQVAGSPLRYAPPPDSFASDTALYRAKTFYDKYYQKMLVLNGVDSRTNSHDDGQRYNWSGELGRAGFPSIGALIAGALSPARPMSYISNGGYSLTGGLTVASRLNSSGLASLYEIAFPNRSQNASSTTSRLYFPDNSTADTRSLIKAASNARTQAMLDAQHLLRVKDAISKLQESRSGPNRFADMADNLGTYATAPQANFNGRNSAFGLYQQGHIALAAYETGVASAVQLSIGGFDTHDNHDANHYPRLMDLLQGLDAILTEAQNRGLADRIVLMVGSDFGRTNKYNSDNGKDHWPITSMMMMGNSTQRIRGNRMVGASTDDHKALWLDPTTLAPVAANTTGAVRLTPGVIHQSLRRLAGVDTAAAATTQFPLTDRQVLDLFS